MGKAKNLLFTACLEHFGQIRPNSHIWLFSSTDNSHYNYNSRYLFEYVKENLPEITPLFVINDPELRNSLSSKYGKQHFIETESIQGIRQALSAGVWFTSAGLPAGYMAGIFHLFTHAMFKALLFLCSGAIIVIIGSNFKEYMGGLHKYMPITNICFLIGCLAIAGIPPFAGFWSKDEIISACFQFSPFMGWFMTVVAGMTAFYMFRLYYVIFWGQSYYELDPENRRKPQEVPFVMWGPLVFLAIISCLCGLIPFGHFVSATGQSYDIHIDMSVATTSVIVAIIGIGLATYMYAPKKTPLADALAKKMPKLHKAALNRFYIDDAWQFFTHKIVFGCFSKPIAWFDRRVIDGTFNFMAWGTQEAGETIRPWQSGDVRSYAIWFLTGTVALTLCLLALL